MPTKKRCFLTVNRGKPSERAIALDSVQGRTYRQRDLLPPVQRVAQPLTSSPHNGQSGNREANASRSSPRHSSEQEPTGDADSSTLFGYLKKHKPEVLVLLTVTVLGGVIATAIFKFVIDPATSATPQSTASSQLVAPRKISTPADLRNYILAQPDWSGQPATFTAMLTIAVKEQSSPERPARVAMKVSGADVEAQSVSSLAHDGAKLRDGPIIIVGRVRESTASPVVWDPQGHEVEGPDTDAELESPDKNAVIFGLIEGSLSKGQVVYFPGVVVAVGHTKGGAGTAYVVSLSAAISRTPTSGAIKVRIDAYSMRTKPHT
jgi:hypothetical protein